VGSTGQRNGSIEGISRRLEAKRFPWPCIEPEGDLIKVMLSVNGEVRAVREVLAQQTIGVFVASALPRAFRVTEVDADIRRNGELAMIGQFRPPVPGQRRHHPLRQVLHPGDQCADDAVAVFSADLYQHHEARAAFDQRGESLPQLPAAYPRVRVFYAQDVDLMDRRPCTRERSANPLKIQNRKMRPALKALSEMESTHCKCEKISSKFSSDDHFWGHRRHVPGASATLADMFSHGDAQDIARRKLPRDINGSASAVWRSAGLFPW